ncbi:MAG TPA: CotH kinase family protein [Bacillales bacterium]|nr:CotH kinase family protein [Bacillales bacterium]
MHNGQRIPVYFMTARKKDLEALRKDIWRTDSVPAKIKTRKGHTDIGIVYRGAHIRKFPKKSFHCRFKQPNLLLGEEVHLNAEYMDPSLMRNKLSLDFFSDIGTLSPKSHHVLLYMNGAFQGVYLQLESVDEHFLKRRGLPEGAIYYAEDDDANFSLISPFNHDIKSAFESGYARKCGENHHDKSLQAFIYQINTIPRADFESEISKYVNMERYLRWLAGVVCTQNFDGFIHNYALYLDPDTGLFEPIPWDYDATWGRDIHGRELEYDYIPIEGYNTLTARILDVQSFRHRYQQIMEEILEDHFTVLALQPKIEAMYRLIRPYVMKDPHKMDDVEQFEQEPNIIVQYIRDRGRFLQNHLSDLE